jgi:hypothetical protein
MYLGFSQALPLNTHVTLFFTLLDLMKGEEWRARLIQDVKARREACYPLPLICEKKQPPSSKKEATDLLEKESDKVPQHHSVRTVWEFLSKGQMAGSGSGSGSG